MARLIYNSVSRQVPPDLFRTIAMHSQHARKLSSKLDSFHVQLAKFTSHHRFLTACRDLDLMPKGLRLRFNASSAREERFVTESQCQLLRLRRRFCQSRIYQLRAGIELDTNRLRIALPPELLWRLLGCCRRSYDRAFSTSEETKKRKFLALTREKTWEFQSQVRHHQGPFHPTPDQLRTVPMPPPKVVNVSSKDLDSDQQAFLELGPKFGISGHPVPLGEVAARVEFAAQTLANRGDKEGSELFRASAIKLVNDLPANSKPNLTKEQKKGLVSLRKDKSRLCLRADKAESIVIMDTEDYKEKVDELMGSGDYEKTRKVGRAKDANPYPAAATRFAKVLQGVFFPDDDAPSDLRVNPSQSRDIRVNPAQSRDIRVNPAQSRDIRVNPAQSRDIRVNPAQSRDIRVNPAQSRDIRVNPAQSRDDPQVRVNPSQSEPPDPGGSLTQDPEEPGEPRGPQARMKRDNPRRYFEYRRVAKSHGVASPAHALPKTHKISGLPTTEEERLDYVSKLKLRMIAPAYSSVDVLLCQHLTKILGALPRPAHSLCSLETGVKKIQNFRPSPNSILLSLDICAMYPSIDVNRSCMVVERRLASFDDLHLHTTLSPSEIAHLLKWCFDNTYIQVKPEQWYRQKKGLAIGKSISSAVAELYMQDLEERIFADAEHKPSLYCRWVDDTLASWEHGRECLETEFLPFLNSLDPDLKWTVEVEENQRINFLDYSIKRHDTWLETSVHRKACSTQHFIPAGSHHPWSHKKSAIRHAFRRAHVYCNTQAGFHQEVDSLYVIFARNGYSQYTITEVAHKVKSQVRLESLAAIDPGANGGEEEAEPAGVRQAHDAPVKVGLPFLGEWSTRMQHLGLRFNVFFALSNRHSVLRSFPSAKIPLSSAQLGGAIYQLSCLCPDDQRRLYIGQTGVPLSKRMEWHERDWKHNRGSFSGHRAGDGHSVQFDEVQIVASVDNYGVRVVLEALHILRLSQTGASLIHNPNLDGRDGHRINKSDGLRLSPLWGPIAKKI